MPSASAGGPVAVPLIDLKAQHDPIRAELRAALDRVIETQHPIEGPEVTAFERAAAAYCDCTHAIGVSSGADAVLLALMALDVGPGDEVVTSAYSYFGTGNAIVRLGARPVYVDIDPGSFNLDARSVAAALTPRTKAILPVHLFGQMAEMAPLLDVSRERGVPLVEDAAQALGASWLGRQAGSLGSFGCFSFFPSRNLGGFADGGMITTSDAGLARKARWLRDHGARPRLGTKVVGGNFRLDALQAAVLLVKLRSLEGWTARRQANAATYRRLFAGAGLLDAVRLPLELPRRRHVYNQFVIRSPRRDALAAHLRSRHIGWEMGDPVPMHLQDCLATMVEPPFDLPEAERAARECLAIPIYPELTEGMQRAVVEAIAEFFD